MPEESVNETTEIRASDIVFDCPHCGKNLAIDCRGAGLTITCPDCAEKIQVPIPEGMELFDIDSSNEQMEIRLIHMRQIITASQNRVRELEEELRELRQRRDQLEQIRSENAARLEMLHREMDAIRHALQRMARVLESAAETDQRREG